MDQGEYCERCKYGPMHFSQARRIEVPFPPPTRGSKILTVCERCLGREEAAKICAEEAASEARCATKLRAKNDRDGAIVYDETAFVLLKAAARIRQG
jgi:hypothetical protein